MSIAVQLDGSEDASSVCADAEVFFGDSLQPPGRVRVSTETTNVTGQLQIRVRSTTPVDEPVVTVYLREGCSQKSTRKYVVLADMLADNGQSVPLTVGPAVALPVLPPSLASSAVVTPSATGEAPAPGRRSRTPRKARKDASPAGGPVAGATTSAANSAAAFPSARISARTAAQPMAPAKSVRASRSRLKLDPLDLAAERDPVLRSSLELLTTPSGDEQQRAAAAALWQALNAQPQDVLRDSQRLKSLEKDVASLLAQNRKSQQAVTALQTDLEQARNARFRNWLVYVLAALLLLFLLAAIFFWRRNKPKHSTADGPWWKKDPDGDSDIQLPGVDSRDAVLPKHLRSSPKVRSVAADSSVELDVDLDIDESMFDSLKNPTTMLEPTSQAPLDPLDRSDFSSSLPGMPRTVNAEELFDVQQQADFFVSLGQFDQAVEVLRHHITDNVETSALAYLDLFDLYHRLDRKDDFDLLRKDFNRVFNAQVPAFEVYTTDDQGLEAYPAALSRIESLWPTPRVLDVIEESIFRKPGSRGEEAFNLTAYRELLLLYSVAKDIVDRPAGLMDFELSSRPPGNDNDAVRHRPTDFVSTNIQPLSAAVGDLPFAPPVMPPPSADLDPTQPHASPRLGLDIDLSGDVMEKPDPGKGRTKQAADARPPIANLIEFDADSISSLEPWSKGKDS